jgi:hypothetical protein
MCALHFGRKIRFSVVLALAALAPQLSAQHTWYVDDDGLPTGDGSPGNPYPTIQRAISGWDTGSGDTIVVRPGIYRERVNFTRGLNVVSEGGPAQTVIDAAHRGSAVTVRNQWPDSRLEGFTLRNGTGRLSVAQGMSYGGGINCLNSRLVVVDCVISGNSTRAGGPDSALVGRGGGIWIGTRADVQMIGCTVQDNESVDGGGISLDRGSLTMSGGSVVGNRALGDNLPGRGGGLHALAGAHIDLLGVDVLGNLALGNFNSIEALGGGIRLESGATGFVGGSTIAANDSGGFSLGWGDLSGLGGGVSSMAHPDDFTMMSTVVRDNWGNNGGGGVHGKGRLDSCLIEDNHGQFGGGVHAVNMRLHDCTLRSNWGGVSGGYDWGGGIFVMPGNYARLESCEIDSNHARGLGGGGFGGVYVDCDIHDNWAGGDSEVGTTRGGGVYGGDLTNCRVWNNGVRQTEYFDAEGGGLYDCAARFCIVYDNVADYYGGAAASQLERCTIANNWTVFGSEAVGYSSVHDSIVRFNSPSDLDGASSATWSAVPSGTPGVGNVFDDPLLWNVSGRDYRLQAGSPCIDAGDPTSPPDPDGSRADIGALPYSG